MSEHFVDISCPGPLAPGPSAPAWVQLSVDTHLNLSLENPKAILIFSIDTFKPGRLKLNRCLYTTTMMSRVVVRFPQTAIGMFGLKREPKVTSAQLLVTYLSLFPCLTSASSPETV